MSKGVLLVNLGSPDSTAVGDVRRYLREFLMDRRVIDVPWPMRVFIVGLVLISRPKQSAEAYHKIWTPEGSPLVVTSRLVQAKLQERVTVPVGLAMRYQSPSIREAVRKLAAEKIDEVLVIPLFPHYAMSSYETAVVRVKKVAARVAPKMRIEVQPPYGDAPDYITALAASAKNYLEAGYDHLLFSFHGVPVRHLRQTDPTRDHCLVALNCCNVASPAHATCYRAQCFKTVAAFVKQAGVPAGKYSVSFQSRLGRDVWLMPYTDVVLAELPKRGIKKLLVICPAFVSDCLETLEEIGIRGRETFLSAGGKEFTPIPCLNEHPLWLAALEEMVRHFLA
ncbi:MAG TPA: ferrochelatase [Verrucomicrobiae bacterium]|nr:ferrochelatase [Verrucomicrobiae bacterium]